MINIYVIESCLIVSHWFLHRVVMFHDTNCYSFVQYSIANQVIELFMIILLCHISITIILYEYTETDVNQF